MAIIQHDDWDLSERGLKDAQRHREKIDEAIRKNVKDVISHESIITKRKGRTVKVPVKGLKDYRFKYGSGKGGGGVGQGDGKPGDTIGRQKKKSDSDNKPGNEKGEDYLETEVDIDYLIEVMFEDLGLPYLDEKTKVSTLIPKGYKFDSIAKVGIPPRIHKKRSMIEAIKRNVTFVAEIMKITGCTEDVANSALAQAKGDIQEAVRFVNEGIVEESQYNVIINDDDLRYKQIEDDVEVTSNAVVIAMMDTSGSMTTNKKYLARSMLFWMVEFLKKMYKNVEIRFISHTTEAQLVDEETFFKKGESGGTFCHTAFEKANYIIDTEYPVDEWNVYCMYISDGEDFDVKKTITKIKEMLSKKINMLGYCEITPTSNPYSMSNTLLSGITSVWNFDSKQIDNTEFLKNKEKRFLISIIKKKEHIYPALKHFLFEKKK